MRKQTIVIFYALSTYVLLQFGWWSFLLMDLTEQLNADTAYQQRQAWMIISEGFVFFAILIWGLYKIKTAINKELALGRRQRNFILAVTHELKTPLASMKLYLQTIKKRKLDKTKEQELIDKTLSENRRLETLVENILTVSRLDDNAYTFFKEETAIEPFVRDMVSRYEMMENIEFTINIEPKLKLEIDQSAMSIVLSNLIDNAIKYAGESPLILINVSTDSVDTLWVIEDNGAGIPKEKMNLAFKKFVRLESEETRNNKGTGLGLYIVSQFVRRQQGKINLSTSELGGLKVNMAFKTNMV